MTAIPEGVAEFAATSVRSINIPISRALYTIRNT